MDSKINFITKYQELKKLKKGKKPLCKDFLKYCNIHERKLMEVFGRDAYTKLQQECGDNPNKLQMERTPLKRILDQYGYLVQNCKELPVTSDWIQAKFKPSPDAINKVHGIKWGDMPFTFIKEYSDKPEWKEVIEILKKSTNNLSPTKTNKVFNEIVEKLVSWTPRQKKNS